jgi:hypothetical protein
MTTSANPINKHPLEPARCPLCGQPNLCALAADPNASECWCDSEEFPPELLAKIPAKAVRKTCVCRECLTNYRESIGIPGDVP